MEAIRLAKEKMGDFKLKSAKDFTVPEHLRMNVDKKRVQLVELEKKVNDTNISAKITLSLTLTFPQRKHNIVNVI